MLMSNFQINGIKSTRVISLIIYILPKSKMQLITEYEPELKKPSVNLTNDFINHKLKENLLKSEFFLSMCSQIHPDLGALVEVTRQGEFITFKSTILQNGSPYLFQSRASRLTILRGINKLNSKIKSGSLRLQPISGHLSFVFNVIIGRKNMKDDQLHGLVLLSVNFCDTYVFKLLSSYHKFINSNKENSYLRNIKNSLEYCNQSFNFSSPHPPTSWDTKYGLEARNSDDIKNEFCRFAKYMIFPESLITNTNETPTIFNEIVLIEDKPLKWYWMDQSNTSLISAGTVYFYYKEKEKQRSSDQDQQIKKTLVKKTCKPGFQSKIHNQRILFSLIQDKTCPYLPKVYISQQTAFRDNTIFSDFYKYLSLDKYLNTTKTYTHLATKLYFLCQTTVGVMFLHTNGIWHLDLKSNNLNIGSTLYLRVCDLGDGFCSKISPQDFKPGFTLHYSSPEYFSTPSSFSQRSDVYSLGVVVYQTLFGKNPFDLPVLSEDRLQQDLRNKSFQKYLDKLIPENLSNYGPQTLMLLLALMCIKCMDQDPLKRPKLQWINVMLREAYEFVIQDFSFSQQSSST